MENYHFVVLFGLVFGVSYFLVPKIRAIALRFNLTDTPEARSSHKTVTPSFGGIAFYISYLLLLFVAQFFIQNEVAVTLIIAISILFFTGFLDDLLNLPAKLKFLGQVIGVGVLMFHPDFIILSLNGFLDIYEIPIGVSITGSMFFLLGLINAFNLIDGIDGLTGVTGIIVAIFYSFMFYNIETPLYLSLCFVTIATLLAFLRFNLSISKKIFMGDTGSLILGLILGLLTLKLMTFKDSNEVFLDIDQRQLPLFLIAVLFVPILDIFRVILIRIWKGVPVFSPDRNHMHHIIIDYGLSHRRASFFIGAVNFMVALFMFFIIKFFSPLQSSLILIFLFLLAILLLFFMNKNKTAIKIKLKLKRVLMMFQL